MKLKKNEEQDKTHSLPPDVLQKLRRVVRSARVLSPEEAQALVKQQCAALFHAHFKATDSLEEANKLAAHNKEFAGKQQLDIEQRLNDTPPKLVVPFKEPECGDFSRSFSKLRLSDAIQLTLYGGLTGLSMYVSYTNVHANLIGTGNPLFIEDPSKAMFIAMIAPAVAAAIKTLPNLFKREAHQSLCKRLIYGVTAVSAVAWTGLFAYAFDGLSTELPDLDDLISGGDSTGHWLTFSQLFTEIMISASLFQRFQSILDIYEPVSSRSNPDFNVLQSDLEHARVQTLSAEKVFEQTNNALSQHKAKHELLLQEGLSQLATAQAQYRDLHQS